jgi:A/G-specific adenine glycosylase
VPGVGDSIAKSVLCFGHARRVVPLHSAAARVATRFFAGSGSRRWQLRLDLYRLAGAQGPDAEFTSAVLELGTRVCVAQRPKCGECPLQTNCRFKAAAEVEPTAELAAA